MGRKTELVNRRDRLDAEASVDEDARVAGECRRVAGDGDDERQAAGGEFARLGLGAGARRVEQGAVERRQLSGPNPAGGRDRGSRP